MTETRIEDPMVQLLPEDRKGTWMQTYTGGPFYPLDPRPSEVRVRDVAHGLAMTCRYGGHTKRFYSVAEHCVHVARHVPDELKLEALFHDAAEAYIGDMVRPLKHTPSMEEYRRAEDLVQAAVYAHLGIVPTPQSRAVIKTVDDRILIDETSALMHDPHAYTARMRRTEPLGVRIACWDPGEAEQWFLNTYYALAAAR